MRERESLCKLHGSRSANERGRKRERTRASWKREMVLERRVANRAFSLAGNGIFLA